MVAPTSSQLFVFQALLLAFWFVWGAAFGSFLNVVVYRLPRGLSLVRPGSSCPSCGAPIRARHNVPIFGWVILRGRCADCRAPFSVRYALVELLTALLAVALFLRVAALLPAEAAPVAWLATYLPLFFFVFVLLAVVFIDAESFVIPGSWVTPGIAVGVLAPLAAEALGGRVLVGFHDALVGAAAGGGALLLLALGFLFVRRKEGMGEGDIILVMLIGAFLGPVSLLFVFLASSLQGLLFTVLFWRRVSAQGLRIPFGPFLALAALEWLFLSDLLVAGFERWSALS